MPTYNRYRRKTRYRPRRRVRRYKRATTSMKLYRPPQLRVHSFKRKMAYPSVTISSGTTGYFAAAYTFALDDLPNYTEFTSLFDRFMISYVKIHIVNRSVNLSQIESYNNAALGFPEIVYCVDNDDNTAPAASAAGMNTIRERGKAKGFLYSSTRRSCSIGLRPAVLSNMYEGVAATAYSPQWRKWISTTDYATPHYGLKYVIRVPFNTGVMPGDVTFDVFATYWFKCKDTL